MYKNPLRSTIVRISMIAVPIVIFFTALSAMAASVSLRWDPNDPTPEGYRVFARRSDQAYNYSQPDWEGSTVTCTIDNLADQTDYYFVVRAFDGTLESADSQEVHFVPAGTANLAPTAVEDSYTVAEGGVLTRYVSTGVLANDSDPEGDALTVSLASGVAHGSLTLNANGGFTYAHNSGETLSDDFTYTLSDGHGNTDSAQAIITITPVNDAPTAHAGNDRSVAEGLAVTLDGSGSSDPDDSILSFLWVQTAGPSVSLSSGNTVRPTFTTPLVDAAGAALEFRLTVRDSAGASSSDTCRVTVTNTTDDTPPPSTDPDIDTDVDGTPDSADMDDDDDGMPDAWEILFGLDPTVDDADSDLDQDGISNHDEYRAGLEPDDSGVGTAPDRPTAVSPVSYAQVTRDPILALEEYSDADGDAQIATQWQLYDTNSGDCLLDVVTDRRLNLLQVPLLLLNGGRTYHWRVRFFDSGGRASAWSIFNYFITDEAANDLDGNGIPDNQEGGDVQADVTRSLLSPTGSCEPTDIVVASVDTISEIEQVALMDPAEFEIDETTPARLPSAMVAYKLVLYQPGQRARVTIHLSEPAPGGATWFKYDKVNGWRNYSDHTQFSADRQSVTVEVKDGGYGDADGVANGIIVDPAGLSASADGSSSTVASGGGGGCFVATIWRAPRQTDSSQGPWQWVKNRMNHWLTGIVSQ